jgi:hypothetical protein
MGVILTRHITSSSTGSGSSGAFTNDEKLALEMEMEFKAAVPSYYKELDYTDGNLTNIGIWLDDTKVTKLFNKSLLFNDGNLLQTLLTRISDSSKILKLFNYTDGNLTSVTVSAG